MAETSLDIRIRPGIRARARHRIEDTLQARGFDVAGGGEFLVDDESDVMLFVDDAQTALPTVIEILQNARVGTESVVVQGAPNKQEHPVYAKGQLPPARSWWKWW